MTWIPLYSQYIYSLILYTINNKHLFTTNNEVNNHKTRCNNDLHHPWSNLSKFNKGAYISGVKVFNHLPQYIKAMSNDQKIFKATLKKFLCHHSFYSMEEYYEYKEKRWVYSTELAQETFYDVYEILINIIQTLLLIYSMYTRQLLCDYYNKTAS
jgi:hypothetical protein